MSSTVIPFPETREHRYYRWQRVEWGLQNGRLPDTAEDFEFHQLYSKTQEFLAMDARAIATGRTEDVIFGSQKDKQ